MGSVREEAWVAISLSAAASDTRKRRLTHACGDSRCCRVGSWHYQPRVCYCAIDLRIFLQAVVPKLILLYFGSGLSFCRGQFFFIAQAKRTPGMEDTVDVRGLGCKRIRYLIFLGVEFVSSYASRYLILNLYHIRGIYSSIFSANIL